MGGEEAALRLGANSGRHVLEDERKCCIFLLIPVKGISYLLIWLFYLADREKTDGKHEPLASILREVFLFVIGSALEKFGFGIVCSRTECN